jgi:hypothetical protein
VYWKEGVVEFKIRALSISRILVVALTNLGTSLYVNI